MAAGLARYSMSSSWFIATSNCRTSWRSDARTVRSRCPWYSCCAEVLLEVVLVAGPHQQLLSRTQTDTSKLWERQRERERETEKKRQEQQSATTANFNVLITNGKGILSWLHWVFAPDSLAKRNIEIALPNHRPSTVGCLVSYICSASISKWTMTVSI